ncbi:reverse transcriptase domain-containing protein [Zhongshania sp.]|uniref:reverse transcriptase domain-containing protein n=1 Tax=Zhongshania sp. TaxID=1971902 RepID=UPI0035696686
MDVSKLSPQALAIKLGTSYGQIQRFYYRAPVSNYYTSFAIPKKNGGARSIDAPKEQLKTLQYKILNLLEPLYHPRNQVHGFVRGRSIVSNAGLHVRRNYVFNIDLEDFFNTITFPRVRGMLIGNPYGLMPSTASVIAHLCCFNGRLPQGAPSSPLLANMICAKLDAQLTEFALDNGFYYTRYADDITFSFNGSPERAIGTLFERPSKLPVEFGEQLIISDPLFLIINENGFSVNSKKVRLQGASQKQVVTGLVVNKKVNVDRRYIRKTSAMIYSIEVLGSSLAQNKFTDQDFEGSLVSHIQGRLIFIRQVKGADSAVYLRLAHRFNDLHSGKTVPLRIRNRSSRSPVEEIRRRKKFSASTWAIEVNEIWEGSAFMIPGGLLVTNAHVFPENDFLWEIKVSRPDGPTLSASILDMCRTQDLVVLKVNCSEKYPGFELGEPSAFQPFGISKFDEVLVCGYPSGSRVRGLRDVNVFWSRVSNLYTASAVDYGLIDKEIYEGNSGGPVLDDAMKVVGVASRGQTKDGYGANAFICISTVIKFLKAAGL